MQFPANFQATSVENAILRLTQLLQAAENSMQPPQDRVNVTWDADTGTVEITVSLPVQVSVGADGISLNAQAYTP